jgi:hypothetical protein
MLRTAHAMNYPVRRFKSLTMALSELKPFVRGGKPLPSGRPFNNFGKMLPREAWANWLVCAVVNAVAGAEQVTFTTDPVGGDGVIQDTKTGETWPTEHVMAPQARGNKKPDVEAAVVKAVADKQKKGEKAYASGKTLIVFSDVGGGTPWFPNKVAKQMPANDFAAVGVVSLHRVEDGEYVYSVSELDPASGTAPTWLVRIAKDFDSWTVERFQ